MKRRPSRGRRLGYSLYHLVWESIDLLLPPSCGGCARRGYRWCTDCQSSVRGPTPPLCVSCGQTWSSGGGICASCKTDPPAYAQLRSWTIFEGRARRALHDLKYRRNVGLGEALSADIARFVATLDWPVDLLMPVPLGKVRLRERGYNQAGLISWPLSLALGIAHNSRGVWRMRETSTQVGLNRRQRRDNVDGAFEAAPTVVRGRTVLLLDDVATTGATVSACARGLRLAGAKQVFALTVARARQAAGA